MASIPNPVDILLIDDCLSDTEIFAIVVGEIAPAVSIRCISNGSEALEFLRLAKDSPPKLIVLDSYLPAMTGVEVLNHIRQELKLLTPVIFLSSSKWESDVREAYQSGASSYLAKPGDLYSLREIVSALVKLWIRFAKYPEPALANSEAGRAPGSLSGF